MQLPMGKYASMSMYMRIQPGSTQNRQSCRRASSKNSVVHQHQVQHRSCRKAFSWGPHEERLVEVLQKGLINKIILSIINLFGSWSMANSWSPMKKDLNHYTHKIKTDKLNQTQRENNCGSHCKSWSRNDPASPELCLVQKGPENTIKVQQHIFLH